VCKRLAIMMVPGYSNSAVVVMRKLLIHIHLMPYKKELPIPVTCSCQLVCEIRVEIKVAMVAINLVTKH